MEQRRLFLIALGVCAFLAIATPARADSIPVTASFGTTGSLQAADTINMTPFDPALGTLDAIAVQVRGSISGSMLVQTGVVDPLGNPVPVFWAATVDFSVDRFLQRFFGFVSPYELQLNGTAPSGATVSFSDIFDITFTLDATSDLVGFAIPSVSGTGTPPSAVYGPRSSFLIDPIQPVNWSQVRAGLQPLVGVAPLTLQINGAITMTYEFTPAGATTPVPEPSTAALVGLALAVLLVRVTAPSGSRSTPRTSSRPA